MEYKNNDLKIGDILKFSKELGTIPIPQLEDMESRILVSLRGENPNKKYYRSSPLLVEEWNMLVKEFDSVLLEKVYEHFLTSQRTPEKL